MNATQFRPHRIEHIPVYHFDALSDAAKEKAREWYRQGALEYEWWDCTEEDFRAIATILGVDVDHVYFSVSWSQSDYAAFTGSYRYAKGCVKAIKAYAPQDKALHDIALSLQQAQRPEFYRLTATVTCSHRGHLVVDVEDSGRPWRQWGDWQDGIEQALRDLAHWLYVTLRNEAEYLLSDEAVDESIRANEYEFDAEGERI